MMSQEPPMRKLVLVLLLPLIAVGLSSDLNRDLSQSSWYSHYYRPQANTLLSGEECHRECRDNDARECHFSWSIHDYQTLSRACYDCPNNPIDCWRPHCVTGDGVRRRITVVNNQMPGPLIQVCQGDRIIVDLHNSLSAGTVTIHWHGQTMRAYEENEGIPYMDGVPGVTQCPILPGQDFRYDFVATEAGTHWWHAHSGYHRTDGVYGGLIVREARDPHQQLYDYDLPEHVFTINSWLHLPIADKYMFRYHGGEDGYADSVIINGRGPNQKPDASELSQKIPYERFKVTKGSRYRFRFINVAGINCPVTFSIDEHPFTAIATDGNPFDPVDASSLVIYPGERFDVIISTDATPGTYWMSFVSDHKCGKDIQQFALLEYTDDLDSTDYQPDSVLLAQMKPKPEFTKDIPAGVQINSYDKDYYTDEVSVADLRGLSSLPSDMRQEKADLTLYLSWSLMKQNNKKYYSDEYYPFSEMTGDQSQRTGVVNNISLALPVSPLLTSTEELAFCNADSPPDPSMCHDDYCECLHMHNLPLDAIVDLVFIDEGEIAEVNHPIHTHGYHFWVLGMDRPQDDAGAKLARADAIDMDNAGLLKRNLVNPPLKDTIKVPHGGYVIARIKATNPGYWLTHCHFVFHSKLGMDMVIHVGEHSDLPPPPFAFDTCSASATNPIE